MLIEYIVIHGKIHSTEMNFREQNCDEVRELCKGPRSQSQDRGFKSRLPPEAM